MLKLPALLLVTLLCLTCGKTSPQLVPTQVGWGMGYGWGFGIIIAILVIFGIVYLMKRK